MRNPIANNSQLDREDVTLMESAYDVVKIDRASFIMTCADDPLDLAWRKLFTDKALSPSTQIHYL